MRVSAYVYLLDETGSVVALRPGDEVPSWASVTNPDVLDEDAPAPAPAEEEKDEAPAEAPAKAATPRRRRSS